MKVDKLGQILYLVTRNKSDEEKQRMVKNLIVILQKKRRTYLLFPALKEFQKCLEKNKIILTLSREESRKLSAEIKNRLVKIFGSEKPFEIVINKKIISGFVARSGDYLVDASIKGLFRRLRNKTAR